MDSIDGNCMGRNKDQTDGTNQLPEGMALMSSSRDALYYTMNHKIRGMVYIFNHQLFEHCPERHGTMEDSKKLQSCFRALKFDVQNFNDLNLNEIEYHIQMAVDYNHNNHDCFVMVVLSHGDVDILWAKDKSYNPKEVLFNKFTSDECPSLAGKPKLFFLQACQGGGLDSGTTLVDRKTSRTEFDGLRKPYRIPTLADFLIVYATSKGQYAFRNSNKGSFFITVLCEELENMHKNDNLLTILTVVNRRVAVEFESYNDEKKEYHDRKQMPYFHCALTRLVHFEKKDDNNTFISTVRI